MNILVGVYAIILFFLLTPGILVTLPPNSSNYIVAATHGILFAILLQSVHTFVLEGLDSPTTTTSVAPSFSPSPTTIAATAAPTTAAPTTIAATAASTTKGPDSKWNTHYQKQSTHGSYDYNGNVVHSRISLGVKNSNLNSCVYPGNKLDPTRGWNPDAAGQGCYGPNPAKSSSQKAPCFAKCERMTLEDGATLSFADAKIGDRILTASIDGTKMAYSNIASLPHQGDDDVAEFYQLITESGRTVLVTADHLMALAPSYQLTPAKHILIGQSLHTVAGPEQIITINIVLKRGIATAVTEDGGLIVVNGFIASPFGRDHDIVDMYCNLHRIFKSEMILDSFIANVAMALVY